MVSCKSLKPHWCSLFKMWTFVGISLCFLFHKMQLSRLQSLCSILFLAFQCKYFPHTAYNTVCHCGCVPIQPVNRRQITQCSPEEFPRKEPTESLNPVYKIKWKSCDGRITVGVILTGVETQCHRTYLESYAAQWFHWQNETLCSAAHFSFLFCPRCPLQESCASILLSLSH